MSPECSRRNEVGALLVPFFLLALSVAAFAQTVAVLDPEGSNESRRISDTLRNSLSKKARVLDPDLASAAFGSFKVDNAFNLDASVSRDIGAAIGCSYFILVRTDVQRRSTFGRPEYYEAHAAYYLISSITGGLTHWEISTFEEDSPKLALDKLNGSVEKSAQVLLSRISSSADNTSEIFAGIQTAETADAQVRPPLPFRRISPRYTAEANLHAITATVDIEAAIGSDGTVLATRILRWAGYGLDESVEAAVRTMQWRPADRKGKTLPMRVLLRYNFREIKEGSN